MKHLFLLSSFLLLHFLACSQAKITDFAWIGQNDEFFKISKKTAYLRRGDICQEFKVVKYVKKSHIILSQTFGETYLEQKYNIVSFTKANLILAPEGRDKFFLNMLNEQNQYVFVNNIQRFKFEKLHFETTIHFYYKVTLDIDSSKVSKVVIRDDYINETSVINLPINIIDYTNLISILAQQDISRFPEEYRWADHENDVKCCNSIFEVRYNGQIKRCIGCTYMPFNYSKLENFLWDYIGIRASAVGNMPTIRL